MKANLRILTPFALAALFVAGAAEAGPRGRGPAPRAPQHRPAAKPARGLTQVEYRRLHMGEVRNSLDRIDLNRDGYLSAAELGRGRTRVDLDGDGHISASEMRMVRTIRRRGMPVKTILQAERQEANQSFRRLDRDNDGRLDRRELNRTRYESR